MFNQLKKDLEKLKNPEKAVILQGFFKTGKGEYGEGDVFWGITVPLQRQVAKKYLDLGLAEIEILLSSQVHEQRLVALLILVQQYQKGNEKVQEEIANFYIKNTKNINNWDLVDLSAHLILGSFLEDKDKGILCKLAQSKNLWERRIAIISTFHFIKKGNFKEILFLSEILLHDEHDLIQKAVGWMLREIGKRDQSVAEAFLLQNYQKMPRTMLRYAIERFSEEKRAFYMKK